MPLGRLWRLGTLPQRSTGIPAISELSRFSGSATALDAIGHIVPHIQAQLAALTSYPDGVEHWLVEQIVISLWQMGFAGCAVLHARRKSVIRGILARRSAHVPTRLAGLHAAAAFVDTMRGHMQSLQAPHGCAPATSSILRGRVGSFRSALSLGTLGVFSSTPRAPRRHLKNK